MAKHYGGRFENSSNPEKLADKFEKEPTKRQTRKTEHRLKEFLDRGTAESVEHRGGTKPTIPQMACKELNFHNCATHGSLAKLTIRTKKYNKFYNNMKKELKEA